ncbi:uncharacterized protein LOC103523915 [Trichonephila clavata]|uniref:Uncharacterized protein LOC103523915 n=1 Tax=Trichonephila clavata TaxID=2740835 RepID=A0A8X6ICH3_TRICU|nr:uncharacterized protein LOC103523915 [Trichonephila clavata]
MYPEPDWVRICTDGSPLKDFESAGAGVYYHLFSFYLTTGKFTTAFDGELAALEVALAQLHCHLNIFIRAVVFCDSKAAVFAVHSNSTPASFNILDCKKLLKSLSEEIVLQGIHGHGIVAGNVFADHLAKKGTLIQRTTRKTVSFTSAKCILKKKLKDLTSIQYTERNSNKIWWNYLKDLPMRPRRKTVAEFRLATVHDCLLKHLY